MASLWGFFGRKVLKISQDCFSHVLKWKFEFLFSLYSAKSNLFWIQLLKATFPVFHDMHELSGYLANLKVLPNPHKMVCELLFLSLVSLLEWIFSLFFFVCGFWFCVFFCFGFFCCFFGTATFENLRTIIMQDSRFCLASLKCCVSSHNHLLKLH